TEQLKSDLTLLNLFDFAPETSFRELDLQKDFYQMNFDEWGKKDVSFVLKIGQKVEGGKLALEALLYDISGQKKIFGTRYQYAVINRSAKRGTVLRSHNLGTGERKLLSNKEGMNSGASWAPSGSRIAATLSFSGKPEIYFIDPAGGGVPESFSRQIQVKRIG